MFKKLKDKLAEEVKSSPQRIQQFAQAAQAAVTSASSSISDITNSDLFSIGDSDGQNSRPTKLLHSNSSQASVYEDSCSLPTVNAADSVSDITENQRQRKLSNSSFASDISFRLPSYETPSMYHLQSDIEVSASEAEERGFSNTNVNLERVTKEQLYAAYRRTQERYTKYRTQYGDLARHYKLLEKENAKARSVLVETQDKALRRISELREQCTLEQSAKAHLEKALRIELEERNIKIDTLNTKIKILQNNTNLGNTDRPQEATRQSDGDYEVQLINLSCENDVKPQTDETKTEINLNVKIEKIEQLLNKYKESLKTSKDKNSQLTNELLVMSNEIENKNKEIDSLKIFRKQLDEAKENIHELNTKNEDLQNKLNAYDFSKTKEMSTLEIDLQRAKDEMEELQSKIAVFSKREEEYAISLAENKLRIHKELENKESQIKSLTESLSSSQKEVQSLKIIINDCKSNLTNLEEEKTRLSNVSYDLNMAKSKITDLESSLQDITKKYSQIENIKSKLEEDYKCLQLQLKQETAEKLAMIDRNNYLENRNKELTEDNTKKSSCISTLENDLLAFKKDKSCENIESISEEKDDILKELNTWKSKYEKLESEIQEERVELVKLQSEIEKLIVNHELIQSQNIEFRNVITELEAENIALRDQVLRYNEIKNTLKKLAAEVNKLQQFVKLISDEASIIKKNNYELILSFKQKVTEAFNQINTEVKYMSTKHNELDVANTSLQNELLNASERYATISDKLNKFQKEFDLLKSTNQNIQMENVSLNESNNSLKQQYEVTVQDLENLKLENENLLIRINNSEKKVNDLQSELESDKSKQVDLVDQLKIFENEKINLLETISSIEDNNLSLKTQIENLNKKIEELKNENTKYLIEKTEEITNKTNAINQLEEKVKILTEENIHLESQAQSIASHIIELQSEISEIRISRETILAEKDRLNNLIKEIERNGNLLTEQDTKDTQTEYAIDNTLEITEKNNLIENRTVLLASGSYKSDFISGQEQEFYDKYTLLKNAYDILKEENKRLLSDIEGLQSYLSKISKENSILNDKLRESIATSESSTESDTTSNFKDLNSEIISSKEKIENLLRENTLLIEENLELKDQLQAQNYTGSKDNTLSDDKDYKNEICEFNEKCNNLMQTNSNLEQKLLDSEQLNQSVNTNMQQLQEKNDKLRSSNEKLERRLDEALVSLRHLHSLQENTELEYLRNILYEYLTGSGAHSVTLAKVLAAIVKFDDMQTQLVLQKEKERQGFLRQLGLI